MRLRPGSYIEAAALLFDLDGTLIDSSGIINALWRRWAERHGLDPAPIIAASPGRRISDTVAEFLPAGAVLDDEVNWIGERARTQPEGIVAIPGALDLVQTLPAHRWAVVTAASRPVAEQWLQAAHLPVPKVLITAEDVERGKPDPEGYRLAAQRLRVHPRDTVVFEDSTSGIAAGRAAGSRIVALATTLTPEALQGEDWIADYTPLAFDTDEGDFQIRLRVY
ncbi:HAD-IA family hydrolase [Lacibacterium aquatile]|uniref:HAD-IA family hydrolase n=1 Tax=Lacibacterium aquatile TaxID=1168082 RepID=A0ABW5DMQ9_9PROT